MRTVVVGAGAAGLWAALHASTRGETIILSRPFFADGRGLGEGYVPWADLMPGCTRPLQAEEFFPNAPSVALKLVDTGHFVPQEAPQTFNALLDEFLAR